MELHFYDKAPAGCSSSIKTRASPNISGIFDMYPQISLKFHLFPMKFLYVVEYWFYSGVFQMKLLEEIDLSFNLRFHARCQTVGKQIDCKVMGYSIELKICCRIHFDFVKL